MRRKGQTTGRDNERRFPHHVAVLVPRNGFGKRLDELHAQITALGAPVVNGSGFRRDDRDYVIWCFADVDQASGFAKMSGGDVIQQRGRRR